MPETDIAVFVAAYERVRRANDSEAPGRLWDPNGRLEHPNLSRPIDGRQLPAFNDLTLERLPDLTWELLDWGTRDNVVYLEWRCRATVADTELAWSGVDRIVLKDGRIAEEIVYCDTMPLWSAHDPSMRRPALIEANSLNTTALPSGQ